MAYRIRRTAKPMPRLSAHTGLLYVSQDLPSQTPIYVYATTNEQGKVHLRLDPPIDQHPELLSELDRQFLPVLYSRIHGRLAMNAYWDTKARRAQTQTRPI